MTENIPGAAGPTPERPEQPAEQATQHDSAAQHEATPPVAAQPTGHPGAPEWSPWAPQGQERPAQEQGLPGQEPPTGQPWQQGAAQQPVGGPQQTAAFAQPGYAQMPPGANPYNLTAEQPHGVYTTPRKPTRTKLVVGVAVLALLVGGGAGALGGYLAASNGAGSYNSVFAAPPAANASNVTPGSVTDVANKVLPTVVEIKTQEGEGSGFIVSSDGQIITNNHVIASAAGGGQIEVDFQNGKTASAKIIGRDPTTDVAVIKAQNVSGLPTATLGTSNNLQIGQQVVAIGSPFDLAGTVTTGIVSSMHRPVNVGDELNQGQGPGQGQGGGGFGGFPGFGGGQQQQQQGPQVRQDTVLDAIQTDAAINPGNSGGPLVNMQGQVIGMNSAISSPNSSAQSQGGSVGIGFAIPIDQAKRTAQQIIQTGKATQAQLGVSVTDPTNGQGGAVISDIVAGGAADKAGIKKNDVVTKINDRVITDSDSLVAAVHAQAPGDTVTITLSNGSSVKATLTGKTIDVQN
ncbi:S1C family serine protease [Kutzneria kofuensis]|uniref:Putative serine protease PepD n=1 Tax=Kutzneria kofuensis TaxID=103725 RepID=A0A7W9KG33_9PSEU|nr:trypsin-like peptidase domain-containing protein [Kutzneria kofuensis]MBB5891974.1 putative serine protease PepD [Kutzneria kofuensis]